MKSGVTTHLVVCPRDNLLVDTLAGLVKHLESVEQTQSVCSHQLPS